jgi:hypothetical protein
MKQQTEIVLSSDEMHVILQRALLLHNKIEKVSFDFRNPDFVWVIVLSNESTGGITQSP